MVRHIVLYQLRRGADPDDLGEALSTLATIDEVRNLVCGPNSSPLGLSGKWEYGLQVEFADEAARARYMTDPQHLAVVPVVERLTESLLVFGITSEEGTL
jgi:Stress responsive A/B Barrel Domain